jgi:FkbM family methyltransferase
MSAPARRVPFIEHLMGADGLKWSLFVHDQYVTGAFREVGAYSPSEVVLLRQYLKPGDTVVCAGANVGAIAVPLATHVFPGAVLAFEPQRLMQMALGSNAINNGCYNIDVLPYAVGAAAGQTTIPELDPRFPANMGAVPTGLGSMAVAVVDLDTVLHGAPVALLHLDVEGKEPDALRGAARTIAKHKPILYCEIDRAEVKEETVAIVREMGYARLWEHRPPIFGTWASLNLLALPDGAPAPVDDGNLTAIA